MASHGPTAEELRQVQKRISDIMRDYTAKQKERQDLLNYIDNVNDEALERISASVSVSMRRRGRTENITMKQRVEQLQNELAEKDEVIGRLWYTLAELQERERELMAQSS